MANDENVDLKIRLSGADKAARETRSVARAVDDLGDESAQAARKMARLGLATSTTRVQLGAFSTTLRAAPLVLGGLVVMTEKLTPQLLGAAEAAATLAGGTAGAGAVGLTAVAQGAGVARLGLGGLMDALGGSEEAVEGLTPDLLALFDTLTEGRKRLGESAQEGLLPGLTKGTKSAMRNMDAIDRIVKRTSRTLGGLAGDAGSMFGSAAWGRDISTVGSANVEIIDSLGHGTLALADASRHLLTEAAPLAVWLADMADRGAELTAVWVENKRQTGELAMFFRQARTDLELFASAAGHGGRGIINLFGANDVDGTRTLRNLDAILGRFERWSNSPAAQKGIGEAIVNEIPDAVAATMDAVARNLPDAAHTAAEVFIEAFIKADVWGKALVGSAVFAKLGGGKLLKGKLGDVLGAAGLVKGGRGSLANPLYVIVVNDSPTTTTGPGKDPKGPKVVPVWWRNLLKGGGRALVKGGAVGAAATGLGWVIGEAIDTNRNLPTGAPARRREAAGHVPFDPGAMTRRVVGGSQGASAHPDSLGLRRPIELHSHLHLDGKEVDHSVTRHRAIDRASER